MRLLSFLCVTPCVALAGAAVASGSMGSRVSTGSGRVFGATAAALGTNSIAIALSSSGSDGRVIEGALLGTDVAIDQHEPRLEQLPERSVCRGC